MREQVEVLFKGLTHNLFLVVITANAAWPDNTKILQKGIKAITAVAEFGGAILEVVDEINKVKPAQPDEEGAPAEPTLDDLRKLFE